MSLRAIGGRKKSESCSRLLTASLQSRQKTRSLISTRKRKKTLPRSLPTACRCGNAKFSFCITAFLRRGMSPRRRDGLGTNRSLPSLASLKPRSTRSTTRPRCGSKVLSTALMIFSKIIQAGVMGCCIFGQYTNISRGPRTRGPFLFI